MLYSLNCFKFEAAYLFFQLNSILGPTDTYCLVSLNIIVKNSEANSIPLLLVICFYEVRGREAHMSNEFFFFPLATPNDI